MAVSVPALFALSLSLLVAFFLPAALFLLLRKRTGVGFFPVVAGMIAYYLAVFALESALAALLMQNEAVRGFLTGSATRYALYAGLMAGVFEETGRLAAFKLLGKSHAGTQTALAYGIGHGGLESAVLVGLDLMMTLRHALNLNTLGPEAMAEAFPEAASVLAALTKAPAVTFLSGGVGSIASLSFHLAASVLVWLAATQKGPVFLYPLAILLHLLWSFPAGLYQYGALQHVWLSELSSCILSGAVCYLTYRAWIACRERPEPPPEEPAQGDGLS